MNRLKDYREKRHLTQEELAEQSGISVRTIQRIEAGGSLKGHTLKTLAKTLEITEEELLEQTAAMPSEINYSTVKLINLSSLPFTLIPSLNIVAPLLIMLITKTFYPITKKIISLQIIWTVITMIIFLFTVIIRNQYYLNDYIPVIVLAVLMALNAFIILRNAVEIVKNEKLYIQLNFSIL